MRLNFKLVFLFLHFHFLGYLVLAQNQGQLILLQSDATIAQLDIGEDTYEPVGALNNPNQPNKMFFYDGEWWCISSDGGRHDAGVLFTMNITGGDYEELWQFEFAFTGAFISDDKLWGYARYGGNNEEGALGYFDLIDNEFHVVHHFEESNGANPSSIVLVEGMIWGAASHGLGLDISDSDGVIFSYDIEEEEYLVEYRMADEGLGEAPYSLVYNGTEIYGLYYSAGFQTSLFSCELDGSNMRHRWAFNGSVISGRPNYIFNENGRITGVTNDAWFQYVATASSPYLTGSNYFDNQNAGRPMSIMEMGNDYFGVTRDNGDHDLGTIYFLDGGTVTALHSFAGGGDGVEPRLSLSVHDNQIYGFTSEDTDEPAIMYRLDPSDNSFSNLHTFDEKNGENFGNFVQANESYFAISTKGGAHGNGTLVEINAETFETTKRYDFENPSSRDFLYHAGKFYGFSAYNYDDPGDYGYIYQLNTDGSEFEVLHEFDFSDGRHPHGKLSVVNGRLWGVNDHVFSLELNGTDFQIEHDFNDELSSPQHGVFEYGSKVWGVARYGGFDDVGGIFSIDLVDETFTEEIIFEDEQGYVMHMPTLYRGDLYLTNYGNQVFGYSNQILKYNLAENELSQVYTFEGNQYYGLDAGIVPFRERLWGTTNRGADSYAGVLFSIEMDGTDFQVHQSFTDELKSNYTFRPLMIGADLQRAEIQLTGLSDLSYGDSSFEITASSESDADMTFSSSDEDVLAIDGSTAFVVKAGECTITASQHENEEYFAVESQVVVEIQKAELTVSVQNETISPAVSIPEFVLVYEGFVNGDTEEDIVPPSVSTDAEAGTTGEYLIELHGGSADNYSLTLRDGSLIIEASDEENQNEETEKGQSSVLNADELITEIVVYPNPVHNQFMINGNQSIKRMELFDSSGKYIKSFRPNSSRFLVDDLDEGIYILKVISNSVHSLRLIKQ